MSRPKVFYQAMCSNDDKGIYVLSGLNASGVPQNEFHYTCD